MAEAPPVSQRSFVNFARQQEQSAQQRALDLAAFLASNNVDVQNLNPEFRSRLTRAMEAIPEDLRREIRIVSGARSQEEQAALRARYESGQGGRAARPGASQHNFGAAVDLNWNQMSPAAQAAWTKAAQEAGIMRQYSALGHWGPSGADGRPWRPGTPLGQYVPQMISRTGGAAPRPQVDSNSARAMGVDPTMTPAAQGIQTVPMPMEAPRMNEQQFARYVGNNSPSTSNNPALAFQEDQNTIRDGYVAGRPDIRSPNTPPAGNGLEALGRAFARQQGPAPVTPVYEQPFGTPMNVNPAQQAGFGGILSRLLGMG